MAKARDIPDWETLLAHAALLQAKAPNWQVPSGTW